MSIINKRTVILCKIASQLVVLGSPPQLVLGSAYSYTFTVRGGTGTYTWTETGALPTGVTFTDNGNGTATIHGTPSVSGSFPINVYVKDSTGASGNENYVLVVPPLLVWGNQTKKLFRQNALTALALTMSASGGKAPYSFTVLSGGPAGLTLSSAGVFSGTPTTIATYNTTVQVTDANANTATAVIPIIINSRLVVTSAATPTMEINTNYSYQYTVAIDPLATGALGALTFSAGSLIGMPSGINISSSGLVSGTPLNHSNSNVSMTVNISDAGTGDTLSSGFGVFNHAQVTSTSTINAGQKILLGVPYTKDIHGNIGFGVTPYSLINVSGDPQVTSSGTVLTINATTTGTFVDSFEVQDALGQTSPFTLTYTVVDPNAEITHQLNGVTTGGTAGAKVFNWQGPYTLVNGGLGGTLTAQLNQASSGQDGYLSASDYALFSASGVTTQTLTTSQVIAGNTDNFINANTLTITLPATPSLGQRCYFTFASTVTSFTVSNNGLKIEAVTGTLVWDVMLGNGRLASFCLEYTNSTDGWKLV